MDKGNSQAANAACAIQRLRILPFTTGSALLQLQTDPHRKEGECATMLYACLFTTSGSVVSWLLSHSQEKGIQMTNEEKVMFLMRLAVETHNANKIRRASSPRGPSIAIEPMSEIEALYKNYEAFLKEKLIIGE